MKLIHKTIIILGATILIGVMTPDAFAQTHLSSKVQTQAVNSLNRGLDKAKQGDYNGAIADYTQAREHLTFAISIYTCRNKSCISRLLAKIGSSN